MSKIGSSVAVPKFHATGTAMKFSKYNHKDNDDGQDGTISRGNEFCHVHVDAADKTDHIEICIKHEVFILKWNARRIHRGFVYIAKAWRGINGCRRYRVQAHKIFPDKTLWKRMVLYESKDGSEIVKPRDMARLLPSEISEVLTAQQ